jgi:phosphatidylserine/phosphatidylglycerophosphate/cardiolipin synthase-like enzyme
VHDAFRDASAGTLRRLADAFRSGQLGSQMSAFSIAKIAAAPQAVVDEVVRLQAEGISPNHLTLLLEANAAVAEARAGHVDAQLVWTGPESQTAQSRDTSVVVQELFGHARRDVLVSTFVVHQAARVFAPLARRMDELPELRARLFVHVGREWRDTVLDSELLREFAEELGREWPSARRPEVYYDPRGLLDQSDKRATWHAKCVVVDDDVALITSANFTEWAHQRNVEAGVLIRNSEFVRQLRQQFESLIEEKLVRRLPGF